MRLRTTAAALFTTGALVFTTAACGGDDTDGYCDRLESFGETVDIDSADITDTKQMAEFSRAFGDVVAVAPDETKHDWQQLSDFFGRLADGEALADFSTEESTAIEAAMDNVSVEIQETCDLKI